MLPSMMRKKVLVVDDEPLIRDSIRLLLKEAFDVQTLCDGETAIKEVTTILPDLILLDVWMDGLDGIATLKQLRTNGCRVPVIMLTGANTVKIAVDAMKHGARDYLTKPFDPRGLIQFLNSVLDKEKAIELTEDKNEALEVVKVEKPDANEISGLIGSSDSIKNLKVKIRQVSAKDVTVLLHGESGTGKEVTAKSIHSLSNRRDGAFVAINCGAIPESLIESELFGYEKGAFTGAVGTRLGVFEQANGGTLFLDEIGELPLQTQVKLLRVLQEREVRRLGGNASIKIDVRIISATNRILEDMVKQGTFRQDLFYRIGVIPIEIPALRERNGDLEELFDYFVDKLSKSYGGKDLILSNDALCTLHGYNWPGNVRELENLVESLLALCDNDEVKISDLPEKLKVKIVKSEMDQKSVVATTGVFSINRNFHEAESEFQKDIIVKALEECGYVQTQAAKKLGITRRILKYRMDKLGL